MSGLQNFNVDTKSKRSHLMVKMEMLMRNQSLNYFLVLRKKISIHKLNDVFIDDEFLNFYSIPSTRTSARSALPRHKKQKLACANANGSDKFPLMIIGRYMLSRPFKGKTGPELVFDYHANRKACMTLHCFSHD